MAGIGQCSIHILRGPWSTCDTKVPLAPIPLTRLEESWWNFIPPIPKGKQKPQEGADLQVSIIILSLDVQLSKNPWFTWDGIWQGGKVGKISSFSSPRLNKGPKREMICEFQKRIIHLDVQLSTNPLSTLDGKVPLAPIHLTRRESWWNFDSWVILGSDRPRITNFCQQPRANKSPRRELICEFK